MAEADYTVDQIIELCFKPAANFHFLAFAHKLVGETKLAGKTRTVETYQTALNSFERFLKETDRNGLEEMGSGLVGKYGEWLQRNGICLNTMSFYMRNLRSMYNQAVAKGVLEQQQPFSNVYTGSKEVVRFAVPLDTIRRIRDLDLSADPHLSFACWILPHIGQI